MYQITMADLIDLDDADQIWSAGKILEPWQRLPHGSISIGWEGHARKNVLTHASLHALLT